MIMLVDADIHPAAMPKEIAARLDEPWRTRYEEFGYRVANPPMIYPRLTNGGNRLDAYPEEGLPGGDLDLMRAQLLDEYDVTYGVLIPLQSHGFGAVAPDFGQAMCRALNDWLATEWLDREPRLRSSLAITHESPEAAAEDIARYAGDRRFVQALLPTSGETTFGRAKYWPIYEAAEDVGLPVAFHLGGMENHRGAGWPSFYLEEHVWMGNLEAALAVSLICEGVFERFPRLRVVLVEGGISWMGPLMWALDDGFDKLRADLPHLSRKPSEYLREHIWLTTQPIEEPAEPRHLAWALEHTGMTDHIMFASDYPHWDFDNPRTALRDVPKELRAKFYGENARALYGLEAA